MKILLETAIAAAILAGKEILEVYDSEFAVEHKDDKSPLTLADKRAHAVIAKTLESTDLPVLSEEGRDIPYAERKDWKQFWMVDPLDGTKEFVKRNGEFTVNIALIENQKSVMGVIYVPVTNMLYFAAKNIGAFRIEVLDELIDFKSLYTLATPLPAEAGPENYTVVCSRSHMSDDTQALVEELKVEHPALEFASRGSSLKLCLIAEGAANLYPRFAPTMEWDTAAGQALVEISNGTVLQAKSDDPVVYNKENLLNPWFVAAR